MIPQLIKGNFNLQILKTLKFNLGGYTESTGGILGSLKNHYPLDGLSGLRTTVPRTIASCWNNRSLSRYNGLDAWQTSKLQNRRPSFDVGLYLTVHKSFVSTSLNFIHRGCTFLLSYPYWTIT
jgi:hypothetical protein